MFYFILLFTPGGITDVLLHITAVDVALHATYYINARFHFLLKSPCDLFLGFLPQDTQQTQAVAPAGINRLTF